jgi:hypothetical protein
MIDRKTHIWWTFLRGVSVINIALLVGTAVWVRPTAWPAAGHLLCAAIYTLVCAFRSFYPRVDLERTVLVDHPLSSIVLGRSAATLAEMAFTVQCALFLMQVGERSGQGFTWLALGILPLIAVAQTACWLGVLTLDHRWHAVEETLWGIEMVALGIAFAISIPWFAGAWQVLLVLALLGCAAAAFVMLVLDVPMYLRRYREQVANGAVFMGVSEGFADALARREPTGSWGVWKHEVVWMTPYFSACVWLSIGAVWI